MVQGEPKWSWSGKGTCRGRGPVISQEEDFSCRSKKKGEGGEKKRKSLKEKGAARKCQEEESGGAAGRPGQGPTLEREFLSAGVLRSVKQPLFNLSLEGGLKRQKEKREPESKKNSTLTNNVPGNSKFAWLFKGGLAAPYAAVGKGGYGRDGPRGAESQKRRESRTIGRGDVYKNWEANPLPPLRGAGNFAEKGNGGPGGLVSFLYLSNGGEGKDLRGGGDS